MIFFVVGLNLKSLQYRMSLLFMGVFAMPSGDVGRSTAGSGKSSANFAAKPENYFCFISFLATFAP